MEMEQFSLDSYGRYGEQVKLSIEAVKQAGLFLRSDSTHKHNVTSNNGKDIKLLADEKAQQLILQILEKSGLPVLAEESFGHNEKFSGLYWVVDPLDGSLNYNRGLPLSCISVALVDDDQPVVGVIYDFLREVLYLGVVGEGAWKNDIPISVSKREQPQDSIVMTGFPVSRDFSQGSLKQFVEHVMKFKKVRLLGSAALSLAYVAEGAADAYLEEDIFWWDVAAGIALVQASGGFVWRRESTNTPWAATVFCGASKYLMPQNLSDERKEIQ